MAKVGLDTTSELYLFTASTRTSGGGVLPVYTGGGVLSLYATQMTVG